MVSLAVLAAAASVIAAAPPTLDQLVEVVDISSLAISPDGRWVAFRQEQPSLARNVTELSWWVAELDRDTPPRRVADGGKALWTYAGTLPAEPPLWSSDSRTFYIRARIGEGVQAWAVDLRDGARPLTAEAGDVSELALADSGARLTFSVGPSRTAIEAEEQRQKDQGVRIDASIDPAQSLFAAGEINGRLSAQRLTGAWFRRQGLLAATPTVRKAVSLAVPGAAAPMDAPASPQLQPVGARSPDGHGLALIVQDERRGVRVERPSGQTANCFGEPCALVKSLAWRPGADEVILTLGDAARRQWLVAWRPASGALRTLTRAEGLVGGGGPAGAAATPCALTHVAAVCVVAAPSTPPKLLLIALGGDREPRVLAAPNAVLEATARPPVRLLEWRDADGRTFSGWLMSPPGPPRRGPLFVTYYVCEGFLRGGFGDEFPLAAMAQAGIATLCVNKAYQSESNHDPVSDYRTGLSAVSAAIDLLASQGLVDGDKVGMGGFSFGSEVTTWTAMNSNLLAAASIASTQMEPAYYWLHGAAGRDNHAVLRRSWGLGAPEETPERWRLISPALNAARIRAPLLMQLPEQEYRLSFELFARLSNSTTPVELYVYPEEPHLKTQPRHRLSVYQRNLDWFRFWLQDQVDPDPAKVEQYERWWSMRARQTSSAQP
ncbi:Atxe2 family lasso peptide isopeptidase [Caulobacter hibisci]|uniref:Atxe2 family lasso peptide isopeptidase n=1 Tax=Caulobacter hibisci TaxID=2035993 RepID=A0ABS0SX80_9CAUL|nr:Atxe2 family lasso peptide isopeptidase [Caulobacter hibisci]MBI1684221.1 Atxe2 family lasso peptide isopeptidase [Caulobacter hibisci]